MGVVAVRVKGSLMPAVGLLKRGEEGVYADEPHIRSLIAKGYLTLVSEIYSDDDDALEPAEDAPDTVDQLKNLEGVTFEDATAGADESATEDAAESAMESANEDANESAPKTRRRGKAATKSGAPAE